MGGVRVTPCLALVALLLLMACTRTVVIDLTGGVARVLSGGDRFAVVFIATVPLARTVGVLDVVLMGAVRAGGLTLT